MAFGDATPPSAQTRLNAIRNAIHTLMTGGAIQSISRPGSGGEQVHFGLRDLMQLELKTMAEIAATSGPARNKVEWRAPS